MRETDNTAIAWLIAAIFLILIISILAWNGGPSKAMIEKYTNPLTGDGTFIFSDMVQPLSKTKAQKTASPSNQNTIPVVVDSKVLADDKKIMEAITPLNPIGAGTGFDIIIPDSPGGSGSGLQPIEITQPVLVPDVMPEFPGGEKAMLHYLQKNIHYPFHLLKNDIAGIVYLSFIVDKDGSVTGIKVLRGVKDGEALAEEAVRVVLKMPQWKPGIQGGKNVPVIYMLPVNFMVK